MHIRHVRVFWVLSFVLFLLLVVLVVRSYHSFHDFRDHRSVLFSSDKVVESWMSPLVVERHFGISLNDAFDVLGVPSSSRNRRLSFSDLCLLYELDCVVVLEDLNDLR
jgi:hypothetical protein